MARPVFQFTPPSPLNAGGFVGITALGLALVYTVGPLVQPWLVAHGTLTGVVVTLGFALYMAVFWGVAAIYLTVDATGRPGWFAAAKIQRTTGARAARRLKGLGASVRRVLFNQLFGTLPVLFVVGPLLVWRGVSLDDPIPAPWVIVGQLLACVLVEEVLFYTTHRTLHLPPLMRRFHRIHHEWREPIAITTHHVHWVEHMIGNLLPVFAGPVLVGAGLWTLMIWVVVVVVNALHTHSGYHLPWLGYAVDHDWHHFHIHENFGAIGLVDRVLGTDTKFRALAEESRE